MQHFCEIAQKFIGQKVAVLCSRYQYRGILSTVAEDCIVLANATAVETSGASLSKAPQVEDNIGGSIIVKNDAIELLYQPTWCAAKLPNE